jgi:hypothetical protein
VTTAYEKLYQYGIARSGFLLCRGWSECGSIMMRPQSHDSRAAGLYAGPDLLEREPAAWLITCRR